MTILMTVTLFSYSSCHQRPSLLNKNEGESARKGTRTPTQVHGLDPEPSASTNSAIRAFQITLESKFTTFYLNTKTLITIAPLFFLLPTSYSLGV